MWTVLALAGTAASLVPVALVEATALTKAVLGAAHLVVAAVVVPAYLSGRQGDPDGA